MELKQPILGEFADTYGHLWAARLDMSGPQPTVCLTSEVLPGRHVYNLTQFLCVAGASKRFRVTLGDLGDAIHTLPAAVTQEIAQQALGRINGREGHYELRWVPADPAAPF